MQTDFYSRPRDKEVHCKALKARWRIANNALEVGNWDDAGDFKRKGQPRKMESHASVKVTAIEDWTRLATPATEPKVWREEPRVPFRASDIA